MWIWRGKRMFRQKYLPQLINRVCSKSKKFSMYSLSTSLWWYFSGHDLCEPNAHVILPSNFISTAKKVLDLFYQINTIWFPLPAGSSWLFLPFHSLDWIYSWDKLYSIYVLGLENKNVEINCLNCQLRCLQSGQGRRAQWYKNLFIGDKPRDSSSREGIG